MQSVLRSTHRDFEIFVVDQSGDDRTYEALQPILKDSRGHYLFNGRQGYGAASSRNIGIAASAGEIVAVTDDDVEVRADWLERLDTLFLADTDLDFVAGRLTAPDYDRSLGYTPSFDADPATPRRKLALQASGANFSMRRTLLDRVGGYDEFCGPGSRLRASDDTDLLHRVIRSGAKIRVDPQVEVVHTHGFRNQEAVVALSERYAFGNGGNYGRFLRRGDLMAGVTFTYREVHRLARAAISLDRSWFRAEIGGSRTRVRGFITGFRLPRDQGYVNGDAMRRLTYLANVLRRESVDT